ncbi:MAG: cyclic nucleotide-binding domain-containing protein [Candidatus Schekmanbacteria bacterium]|nr:cyclic nucleotide-binding domain-containing protein [Candidatus Schekmanbacteria bacterium]
MIEVGDILPIAKRLADRGLVPEAAELLTLAQRTDPDSPDIELQLAHLATLETAPPEEEEAEEEEEELDDPQAAIVAELQRESIEACHFVGLAYLYFATGEIDESIDCLEAAKSRGLPDPTAYKLHGQILLQKRDFEGAAKQFAMSRRLNPFDRNVADCLARSEFECKRFEEALNATVDCYLLLRDSDKEHATRLKTRIQGIKRLLGWSQEDIMRCFAERQQGIEISFQRLAWHQQSVLDRVHFAEADQDTPTLDARVGGRVEIAYRLRRFSLWSHLTDEQIFKLTAIAEEEVLQPDAVVFAAGSLSCDVFLLESGSVAIEKTTSYGLVGLASFSAGELFGEGNFIRGDCRIVQARVTRACALFRFGGEVLRGLVAESPELGVQLFRSFWHVQARRLRGTNEKLKSFFAAGPAAEVTQSAQMSGAAGRESADLDHSDKIKVFQEQGLSRKELLTLATYSREQIYQDGEYLFHEGDNGDTLYIIAQGRIMVTKYIPGGGEEALAILARGDFFGEMSLIDGEPRSASAKAYGGAVTVLQLGRESVDEILSLESPAALEFLRLLCRMMARRLCEIDEKLVGWHILSGDVRQARPRD